MSMVKLLKYPLFTQCLGLCLIPMIGCADSRDNGIAFNDVASNNTAVTDTDATESVAITLYLLGYEVPKSERERVVAQDIKIFESHLQKRASSYKVGLDFFEIESPKYQRDLYHSTEVSNLTLCDFGDSVSCLNNIADNPAPYRQSLETLSHVMNDIDTLRQSGSSELVSVFPDNLRSNLEPTTNYQYFIKPLTTQSALAYYDNPNIGLNTVCDNISFSKKLIQSKDSMLQTFIGVKLLKNNLEILENSTELLPYSCSDALKPMTTRTVSICPTVNSEARSFKNMLLSINEIPILFSHEASIKLVNEDTQLFCNAEWTNKVKNDEFTSYPIVDIKNSKLFNRIGSMFVNITNITNITNIAKVDYSDYQNRLLDANANLRLWQAAIDPQCQDAVSNPEVLDSLFMGEYSNANAPLVNYLNTFLEGLNRVRALHVNDQKRLTITAYDQSNNTIENSKVNTVEDLSYISVSCRTVQ